MAYYEYNGTAGDDLADYSFLGSRDVVALRGRGGNDTLIGGEGNDRFDSGDNDLLLGMGGDDAFFFNVNNIIGGARGMVDGGAGNDSLVFAIGSYQLPRVKPELARLGQYFAAGDLDTTFVSDILHIDIRHVETAILRVDGVLASMGSVFVGPHAVADAYAATEDQPLTVTAAQGVLANDTGEAGGLKAQAGVIATALGGTVTLAADGSFAYAPAANANGADSFAYTLLDAFGRTSAGSAAITVAAVNDAATIGGTATGAVAEDGTLTAAGQLTIADPDAGQAAFALPASLAGTYGSFTFTAAGAWTYTLDNAAAGVQALNAGQTVTDTLTVHSLDGTASQDITVAIAGAAEAAAGFMGKTVGATIDVGNPGHLFLDAGTAVVGSGVEFGPPGADRFYIDVSETRISITFEQTLYSENGFFGPRIYDVDGTLPDIIGVTLVSTDVPGLDVSLVGFDANAVWVNLDMLDFYPGQHILLDVIFA